MTATATPEAARNLMTPGQKLCDEVLHMVRQGHFGVALKGAQRGAREFPDERLPGDTTFDRLCTLLADKIPGASATPAEPEESVHSAAEPVVAPVSAPVVAPVSAAPVMPISVAPVSTASAAIVIERTVDDGTIIRLYDSTPKLMPLIGSKVRPDLGWKYAKRGFLYLGDRDTAPNVQVIAATLGVLAQNGVLASSTVRGDEAARPVSAVPVSARPVSARPAARRQPTRREAARYNSPVTVRQVSPAAPVAPAVPVFVQPAAAPVSAPVAVPAMDPLLAQVMAQMAQMQQVQQQMLASLAGGQAPAAPVAAAVAPVAAVVAEVDVLSAEDVLASLIDQASAEVVAEVESLTWTFRVAAGESARSTGEALRRALGVNGVSGWWAQSNLGQVTFGVLPDRVNRGVLHVRVKAASGAKLSPRKIAKQVLGVALSVHGIAGTSTMKLGKLVDSDC